MDGVARGVDVGGRAAVLVGDPTGTAKGVDFELGSVIGVDLVEFA